MSSNQQKAHILAAIRTLLENECIKNQEEIRQCLELQGIQVNQAMISRTLHQLGAIKMIEQNQTVYRLPNEPVLVSTKDSFSRLVLNIAHNSSLIVIHTTPSSAPLVARLLDQNRQIGILGTVAGDDTVFVAPTDTFGIQAILERISKLLV